MYLQVCWGAKGKMRDRAFHSYWKNACRPCHLLYSPVLPFSILETDFGSFSYIFPTVSFWKSEHSKVTSLAWGPREVWAKVRVPAKARRGAVLLGPCWAVHCLSEPGTASVLTSVLFFDAKGAELKSAVISEMAKQNRPSWQVWLGATEGRQAAYCPPTRNDVSVKGCCLVEAACEVNLSRHTAESSRAVVFTKTFQVRRE